MEQLVGARLPTLDLGPWNEKFCHYLYIDTNNFHLLFPDVSCCIAKSLDSKAHFSSSTNMDDLSLNTLASTPALEPPPGVSPNFINPYSLGPFQVATASICVTSATIVVAARFVTKVATSKRLQLEECTFDPQKPSTL